MQSRHGVEDDARLVGRELSGEGRADVDHIPGTDQGRVGRDQIERAVQERCLMAILWPYQCLQPAPVVGVTRIQRVEIDTSHAGERGQRVKVGDGPGASPLGGDLHRRAPLAEVATCAPPDCASMKLASICGAGEFQKSVCGMRDSGMLPRSNTCALMRSA